LRILTYRGDGFGRVHSLGRAHSPQVSVASSVRNGWKADIRRDTFVA
jgi:hypothetical protein